jgi:dihydrofolate reductase
MSFTRAHRLYAREGDSPLVRNFYAFNLISLDGYFEGPNHDLGWFNVDEEFNEYAIQQHAEMDTIIFGRMTYEMMASYWPTPMAAEENDAVVVKAMNTLPKIVVSRTLERADWNNSRLVRDNLADELGKLKQQPGMDIALFGSAQLQSALLQQGLLDELRILVNPLVLGGGTPLFKPEDHVKLDLVKAKPFRSGNVLLTYRPRRDA